MGVEARGKTMNPFPHIYQVSARGSIAGTVPVASQGVPNIETAPPPEFDGPGDVWSPETLLVAAVANCFILTFRAVSRAARFEWEQIECSVDGVLERVSGVTQFSRFSTRAKLTIKAGSDSAKAQELLQRAEKACLVANSLRGERHLQAEIVETASLPSGAPAWAPSTAAP
ncbi:MAG: OsmC family protein [Steroidobacteraceae bacterium]